MAASVFGKKYSAPVEVIPNFLRKINKIEAERENQIINVGALCV